MLTRTGTEMLIDTDERREDSPGDGVLIVIGTVIGIDMVIGASTGADILIVTGALITIRVPPS